MRRTERQLSPAATLEILAQGEWGTLSLVDETGTPYGVPLSYVLDSAGGAASGATSGGVSGDFANEEPFPHVVFHAAREGRKLACIAHNPLCAFTVVRNTLVIPQKFSTLYACVMAFGTIETVADHAEKIRLLCLLGKKYSPGFEAQALAYAERAVEKVCVFRLVVHNISGKSRESE